MRLRWGVALALVIAVLFGGLSRPARATLPKTQPPDNSAVQTVEVWRIRIANSPGGQIDVSADGGATWTMIGRVSTPAVASLQGYLAAGYAPIGTVAATAVHGIRIRLGDTSNAYPTLINILPREFAATPHFFGGQIAGASGIYTNIPTGTGLFRDLAPYVGSPCYLQDSSGRLQPLTSNYVPAIGDRLVIEVRRRVNELRCVVFENQAHGDVTATYADGTSEIVTHVVKPVEGIGRFDGTSYTGVGAVNTNHTCVITISTMPVSTSKLLEGNGPERRGGFQIEPYYHNTQTDEAWAPQVMILGGTDSQDPLLEGRAPLFYGGINLAWNPADPTHSWICDVQTKTTGNSWIPMPQMIGNQPDAITQHGITAFRLHRDAGDGDIAWLRQQIASAARDYQTMRGQMAAGGEMPLIKGFYSAPGGIDTLSASKHPALVEFYVDGGFAGVTNSDPWDLDWNSRTVADGEHLIEARIQDSAGKLLGVVDKLVYVDNAGAFKPIVISTEEPSRP